MSTTRLTLIPSFTRCFGFLFIPYIHRLTLFSLAYGYTHTDGHTFLLSFNTLLIYDVLSSFVTSTRDDIIPLEKEKS